MNLTASISHPNAAGSGRDPNHKQVIGFEVHQPSARSVWLLGIVGDWHPSCVKFQDHGHGLWAAKIELGAGNYSYRLIVDGSSSDASAAVRTDAFSRSKPTRFFSIPCIAVAEHDDRQDAEPESSPSTTFAPQTNSCSSVGLFITRTAETKSKRTNCR